jgi:hypothetical protein
VNAIVRAGAHLAAVAAALAVTAVTPRADAASSWSGHRPVSRATGHAAHLGHPRANIPPSPDFRYACSGSGSRSAQRSARCRRQALAAVNHAHAVEHIRPIRLPRNFWSLGVRRQVFVITNAERVTRGLPAVQGLTRQANRWAGVGARRNTDPYAHGSKLTSGAVIRAWGSNWAADYNALTADYSWMYLDGWAGSRAATSNIDCTSPRAAGCWGHRDNILSVFGRSHSLVAGAGFVPHGWDGYFTSYAEMFVQYTGRRPVLTYTWRRATRAGAR